MTRAPRDLRELAGLYALNALEPDERVEFERFLETSPDAQHEVDEFRTTAGRIGAAEAVQPPVDLKARVMSEIGDTRQLRPTTSPGPSRRRFAVVGVAVAAVAVVIAGVVGVVARNSDDSIDTDFWAASDLDSIALDTTNDEVVRVFWSLEQQRMAVAHDDLRGLDEDLVFELWHIDAAGSPVPIGTFADSAETVLFAIEIDGEVVTLAITIEPSGGSELPTTDPIAVATV